MSSESEDEDAEKGSPIRGWFVQYNTKERPVSSRKKSPTKFPELADKSRDPELSRYYSQQVFKSNLSQKLGQMQGLRAPPQVPMAYNKQMNVRAEHF